MIPRRRSRKQTPNIVEPEIRTIVEMAYNRTMTQMLQAPIEGYEDAIVVPPINANNFELKQTLLNLVQSNQFTGRQDPHNHLRFFNKVTFTFRHLEVPNTTIKLLLFPFSLEEEAQIWLDKEPPRSILTRAVGDEADNSSYFNDCLNTMATRIATIFASLKEHPIVRYRVKGTDRSTGTTFHDTVPEKLASAIYSYISPYKTTIPQFPQTETCELLILDRSVDMVALVIHEWTYDAMCHDLVDFDGNKYTMEVRGKSGGDPEKKEFHLDDNDPVWLEMRHLHIADVLTDGNYNDWAREMTNFLFAKNKTDFVDGTLKKPETSSSEYKSWMRCDAMIKGWLTTTMEKGIRDSVKYANTSSEIWSDLKERFGKESAPRAYELKKKITATRQEGSSKDDKAKPKAAYVETGTSPIPGLNEGQYQEFVKVFRVRVIMLKQNLRPTWQGLRTRSLIGSGKCQWGYISWTCSRREDEP
nr:protein transport Sec1a-like [Tanacetum cinerariifolium]